MDEMLVSYGTEVKAREGGIVEGYLVYFSDQSSPDTSQFRDFFTPETDYAVELPGAKSAVYFHHGGDTKLGKRRLGWGTMKSDEVGIWVEAKLQMRDEYDRAIYELAKKGKLSWSSGTASHLVEREPIRDAKGAVIAHRVTHWPLGLDASLTPTPAEPRCAAVALKSVEVPDLETLTAEAGIKASFPETSGENPERPVVPAALVDHARAVVTANRVLIERVEDRVAFRLATETKAGRVLSAANVAELQAVDEALASMLEIRQRLQALMDKARPKEQEQQPDLAAQVQETQRLRTQNLRLQTQHQFGGAS